jgi:hypothetical protein
MPGTIGRARIGGPRQRHGAAVRALRGASHGGFPVTPPLEIHSQWCVVELLHKGFDALDLAYAVHFPAKFMPKLQSSEAAGHGDWTARNGVAGRRLF